MWTFNLKFALSLENVLFCLGEIIFSRTLIHSVSCHVHLCICVICRSLGDRGSNSASSVSSVSADSPTMNNSFSFDTREHIYYEPPPILTECKEISTAYNQGIHYFPTSIFFPFAKKSLSIALCKVWWFELSNEV